MFFVEVAGNAHHMMAW